MTAQKSYYVSATAIIIENRNNGLRNRKLDFTRYVARVLLSLTLRKRPRMHAISQMLSVVGVLSTSANVDDAEFTPLVCQETIDKNSAISKWLMLFFELSLRSDEVGTAFANEFRLTITAGSLRITSLITTLTPGVILHLTYGLQVLNRVRQQPMQLSHSMQTIYTCFYSVHD